MFTERCFDGWYNGQDFQAPLEHRMHDYSDGIAFVGINPFSSAIDIPSVIQRTGDINQDGDITHTGDREQTGDVIHTGDKQQTGLFELLGNMIITGNGGPGTATCNNITINVIIGDVVADGISLKGHRHGGVQVGTGVSGLPQ
jgi:hypothetical protein